MAKLCRLLIKAEEKVSLIKHCTFKVVKHYLGIDMSALSSEESSSDGESSSFDADEGDKAT